MALSSGAKIALGCGIALVLTVGGVVVAVFGVAWWGVNKAKQAAERFETDQKGVEEALAKANANPFAVPADGVVQEDRLRRFLAVRKQLHDNVYLKHKGMIEAQAKKENADLSALAQLPFIIAELRAAKARALADEGMSEEEFAWLFRTVYGGLTIAGIERGGSGTVSEAVEATTDGMVQEAEKAAATAEADPNVPPEVKRQLRAAADQVRAQAGAGAQTGQMLAVPPANRALFMKHREEILKYTMGGLELIPF